MCNTIVGAGAVGAGAASCYGSGSDQRCGSLRLRLRNNVINLKGQCQEMVVEIRPSGTGTTIGTYKNFGSRNFFYHLKICRFKAIVRRVLLLIAVDVKSRSHIRQILR
jgi:hypothetical protein